MKPLRPYQTAAVARFLAAPSRRLILAHATGAGKTRTALAAASSVGAERILVVAPALARPEWKAQFQLWAPAFEPHTIRFGRARKSLTKAQTAERDAAYAAPVQIVSYKLLKDIGSEPRDLLILDEIHKLGSPLSQQSRLVKAYVKAHPKLAILGLSATPIPTEVRQLWNPLHTLFGDKWGKPTMTGDVSWSFQQKYCERVENDYGVAYRGGQNLEALAKLLEPVMHRVTEDQFASEVPPLNARPLYLDEKRSNDDIMVELAEDESASRTHIGFITHHIKLAAEFACILRGRFPEWDVFHADGNMTVEQRKVLIEAARASKQCFFVATAQSVGESLSLSFLKFAAIFEWATSPAQAVQLLGRFPRPDASSLTPVDVRYITHPGDEAKAQLLSERIECINLALKSDAKSTLLSTVFQERELTEERLDSMFQSFISSFAPERTEFVDDE